MFERTLKKFLTLTPLLWGLTATPKERHLSRRPPPLSSTQRKWEHYIFFLEKLRRRKAQITLVTKQREKICWKDTLQKRELMSSHLRFKLRIKQKLQHLTFGSLQDKESKRNLKQQPRGQYITSKICEPGKPWPSLNYFVLKNDRRDFGRARIEKASKLHTQSAPVFTQREEIHGRRAVSRKVHATRRKTTPAFVCIIRTAAHIQDIRLQRSDTLKRYRQKSENCKATFV